MKEFVYGSDHQYELLKESLEDHLAMCIRAVICQEFAARISPESVLKRRRIHMPSLSIKAFLAATIRHQLFLKTGLRLEQ